jgi:hypothetical protein
MDTTHHSDQIHQCTTFGPDSCVSQGLKNVHLLIKGDENEHSYLHVQKEMNCKTLGYVPIVRDYFLSNIAFIIRLKAMVILKSRLQQWIK